MNKAAVGFPLYAAKRNAQRGVEDSTAHLIDFCLATRARWPATRPADGRCGGEQIADRVVLTTMMPHR